MRCVVLTRTRYFEHFHPFMPIVRIRDPDACYKAAPVLFWAILVTSCRRYARRESTLQLLVNAIPSEIWSAVSATPVRPPVITALLILSTWSLPTIRFMNDPTYIYAGIALNSCLYLSLHTGKGCNLEFSVPTYEVKATDEEAIYLWAASNIISQRSATSRIRVFLPLKPVTDAPKELLFIWAIHPQPLSQAKLSTVSWMEPALILSHGASQ